MMHVTHGMSVCTENMCRNQGGTAGDDLVPFQG